MDAETETAPTMGDANPADLTADAEAADVISQIANEWAENPPADEETPAEGQETEPAVEEPVAEGETTEEDVGGATEEEAPEEDRGVARLVAREVELRAKEEAFKAREAKVDALEQENAQLRQAFESLPKDFMQDVGLRPYEALESAGHDPDHVVRLILAKKFEKDGKPVPAELRAAIKDAERDYQIRKQAEEIRQFKQQQAAAAFAAKVESDALEYVTKSLGTSKNAPTVAKVAKSNPSRVHSEILDEIARDAQARAGKDPNAALLTFAEAAVRVEKRWAEMSALFGNPAASTPAPETKSTQGAQKTNSSSVKPKPAAPPAKPITRTPPKTQEELEKMALEEAVQEFRRVESAKRPPARK